MTETMIRAGTFIGVFLVMALWEALSPRRQLSQSRKARWSVNLGLSFLNTLLVRITIGGIAYTAACYAIEQNVGVFNWLAPPHWLAMVGSFLLLDFAIYAQHVAVHKIPLLWRLHQVHHTDLDFDASTAIRFHPLEIFFSLIYKVICIVLIGADPVTVIAFEVILNASALFNHGNVYIPNGVDKIIRRFIVTPDMHRIHHSSMPDETDSNYGFSLPIWDRLCRTYRDQPRLGQLGMEIGIKPYRLPAKVGFIEVLSMPFRRLQA